MRLIVGLFAALALTASATQAEPPGIADKVAAFAQPTQAKRLETLKGLLDTAGLAYEVQTFDGGEKGKPAKGHNVVVTIGAGPKDILLTAHYDAEVLKDGTLADGVVDNAASVVALIEAAVELKARGGLKHRLKVIFFDQEELGLIGAFAYAKGPDAGRVAGVINFDVNAYGDTAFYAAATTAGEQPLEAAIRRTCAQLLQECAAFPVYPPSDHLAFRREGVPATSISFLPAGEVHQLWLFMNGGEASGLTSGFAPRILRLIHTPNDKMDLVEVPTILKAKALAVAAVRGFDAANH